MNSKAFPGTAPLVVKLGERVRIRLGNLGAMDHHPIHLHGFQFKVTGSDGGRIPESLQWPETTVLVPTGSTRTVEFVADAAGDWAFHCHMTHHVMTQMGHGMPNLIGVDPSIFDRALAEVVPEFAAMGQTDGKHGEDTTMPPNSLPMMGGTAGFGYVTMGGMLTVLKVREQITDHTDPGWYVHPDNTLARPATTAELEADGIRQEGP